MSLVRVAPDLQVGPRAFSGFTAYDAGLMGWLDQLDLSLRLSRKDEAARLASAQLHLLHLRLVAGGLIGEKRLGPPICVVFEGWDASGKGGAIKRLVSPMDPRHVRVAQFAAPTPDEKGITSCGVSGPCCPGGAGWRCWTAAGTGGCWSSG
jgi:hypothetical protein